MANSRIYFKSEAGGTTVVSRDTTATSGNLVLPASGNVASVDTAVTDNAIARYNGTTGKLQDSGVIVDDNGNIGTGTQSFNGLGGSGFKNYIINGGFDIWQRGNGSFTGWNRSCDMNIAPDTIVQSKYVDTTYGNCILCTGNSTDRSILYSAIELTTVGNNSQFTVGKTFTFSVLIKSNIKVKPFFIFRDSIVGANPVDLFNHSSITYKGGNNVWELLSWTFTVTGSTTSLNNCLIYSLLGETANGTSYIAQVQLEEGSIATPFESRPVGLELSLCQRYYENLGITSFHGYGLGGNGFWNQHEMRVTKRVIPTISTGAITAQTNCGIGTIAASKDVVAMSIVVTSTGAFVADVSNVTASAEL